MNTTKNIIFYVLLFLFIFLISFFFYNIWSEKNDNVSVVEKYKNKVKLNCKDLQKNLENLMFEQSRLIREYIIISFNNLSRDEKVNIQNKLETNTKNISSYLKFILGCEQFYNLLNNYNHSLISLIDSYVNVDSSEQTPNILQILNNDLNSIILYLNTNLLTNPKNEDDEDEEEQKVIKKEDTNNYLKYILKTHLKLIIEQINNYYYKKYLESEKSFDQIINNSTLVAECLTDLLCKNSKNN
jgi:hypothetical protein